DEPTNHLDIGTLKWLEQYLKSYKGTIMLVSHDRYFLDQTVNRIFEVENHKLYKYEGTYSQYAEKKRARREEELRKYQSQQKEIEKQEEIVRRFKGHGTEKLAKRAASREKKLDKIERVARPEGEHGKMKIRFREKFQSGKDVIQAEGLAKSFGYGRNKVELFHQVDFDIKRGERICIVGPNGIGKTTLMKMIMGETEANAGYLKKGHNVKFGYYDQGQRLLNEENTVIEELQEAYSIYSDTEMRSILGRFLFKNDTVFLPIKALSGGEKARLSLLKLMLSGANVLMLDEPTNHLDIDSKEIFEDALLDFPGTSLVVSHDRYFLSKVPTRIVELGHEGLTNFLGKYDYYVEKKQEIQSGKKYLQEMAKDGEVQEETSTQELTAAQERKQKKEEEARQRRIAREKAQLEQEIEETESKIAEIEAEMCKEETLADYAKLEEMNQELQENKEKLPKIYQKWLQCEEC
ncbi:MAG: ABC-F family ATP-binding cassette domain-containing protein, partial [Anaerovoracaceae bacterium]